MTFTQTKTRSFLPIILLFFGVFIFFIFIFFRILVDDLPSVEKLTEIKLSVPLKIYTSDKKLIAEYGKERRKFLPLSEVPDLFVKAFIAAEDASFYKHSGIDWVAIIRAGLEYLKTGQKRRGGSTITMQVARNFYLTRKKTFTRKIKELMLATQIERELSKQKILELYLNKIFLGHRAYGIGAAAQVYYGKAVGELTLDQLAVIAGLPKAPSKTNPITNPEAAKNRRNYVLERMLKLNMITQSEFEVAYRADITAKWHGHPVEVYAPYVAEMVREKMLEKYGQGAYEGGLSVITTISSDLQRSARRAVREGLIAYDRRHGYRGPEGKLSREQLLSSSSLAKSLSEFSDLKDMKVGVVTDIADNQILVWNQEIGEISIPYEYLKWGRRYIDRDTLGKTPTSAKEIFDIGDVIRIAPENPLNIEVEEKQKWRFVQQPEVEGALIALDPKNGAITSLVGGFDYSLSKFNRAVQARRQVGSNFKPFLYSAALSKGYNAATIINDAPIVFDNGEGEEVWRPENYSGRFFGPTRLRQALVRSQNMVSVRILDSLGINYTINYAKRFGYKKEDLPKDLSLALGSGEMTPLELASGYATFANGGFNIEPFLISSIEDSNGNVLFENKPRTVCLMCENVDLTLDGEPESIESLAQLDYLPPENLAERAIDSENAWIIGSMLRDVIKFGTGRRALSLNRSDIAGKTGTTNDQRDAWFSGFNKDIVTTVWVGFDKVAPLGKRETGARAALPIWIDFMKDALVDMEDAIPERPEGLVSALIDKKTGTLTNVDNPDRMYEFFRQNYLPKKEAGSITGNTTDSNGNLTVEPTQIF